MDFGRASSSLASGTRHILYMNHTILAIETSCDETSVAVLRVNKFPDTTEFQTLSHLTLSQATMHAEYGGVYPTMARRDHQVNITALVAECLDIAGLLHTSNERPSDLPRLNYLDREELVRPALTDFVVSHDQPEIDAIAVTVGPGLEPALWVGVSTARALADFWRVPLIPVNHMEGHMLSVIAHGDTFALPHIELPALALLISGAHTEFVEISSVGNYKKIGQTRDDAIGEAFDKVARLMGFAYPGGPKIEALDNEYKAAPTTYDFVLPRPMMYSQDFDFSFSGIKTAVRYLIESLPKPLDEATKRAIAHEFTTAVTEVLVYKTRKAIEEYGCQSLMIGGGVAASTHICSELSHLCESLSVAIYLPNRAMAMDNALMIGVAGALKLLDPQYDIPSVESIQAFGNWHYKHSDVLE